jgi:hypothetical protein
MEDQDLETLARLSASTRQLFFAVVLAFVLLALFGWFLGAVIQATAKIIVGGEVIALLAAMAIGMKLRTPPERFPTIRVLRDRAGEVAYVVTILRGKQVVALVGSDQQVLARPLVLKGTARLPSAGTAAAINAAQSAQMTQALQIIQRRCPIARTAVIRDMWGIASFTRLAKKAISQLPPA